MIDGSEREVASYRGKVVAMILFLTGCPHCREVAREIGDVQKVVGRELNIIGVAVNSDAKERLPGFLERVQPAFPVGYAPLDSALSYLGLKPTERTLMPRVP